MLSLIHVAALLLQGGDSLAPTIQENGLFEVVVQSAERKVQLLRFHGASRVWVNEQPVAAPLNPVVLEQGANRIWGAPEGDVLPSIELSDPPGPVFFDVGGVEPITWSPDSKYGSQSILVVNASEQTVPMLTLVCGGVGPFLRKRVPVWRGLPPLSVMRVELPLERKKGYDYRSGKKQYPLFLSAAGLPGVDPLIQSLSIPRGPGPRNQSGDLGAADSMADADAPFTAHVVHYLPDTLGFDYQARRGGHTFRHQGCDSWRRPNDNTLLMRLNPDARLIELRLKADSGIEQIRIGNVDAYQDFQVGDHPIRGLGRKFWAQQVGDQWEIHNRGVPATHKGLHRNGPVRAALDGAVWIYGTAGTELENLEILRRLRLHSGAWLAADSHHKVDFISDEEYLRLESSHEFLGKNLIVIGNADTNSSWRALAAADMPVQFSRGQIRLAGGDQAGGLSLEGDGFGGAVLQAHPRSVQTLVLFLGDSGNAGARAAIGLQLEQMDDVDFMVVGEDRSRLPKWGRSGSLDHRWRFPQQPDPAEN